MFDFAAFPPEINSARMYAGPGPASMVAAGAAWNTMAAEMRSAATGYGSVIAGLTGEGWLGPSSVLMAAAAAPYVAWLSSTAAAAQQAGAQATAAASAYEAAFAMTVPPAVVATNRMQLANLLAGNLFGQNTAAIAAIEAQYADMWAQDASAMNGYASASSEATQLTPMAAPSPTTSTDGVAEQAATVAQAATASTNSASGSSTGGLLAWLGLAPNTNTSTTGLAGLMNFLDGSNGSLMGSFLNNASVANFSNALTTSGLLNPTSMIDSVTAFSSVFPNAADGAADAAGAELAAGLGRFGALGSLPGLAASAGVGQGSLVGTLAVPSSWGATGAAITPVAATTRLGAGMYHGVLGTTPMVMEDAGPVGMPGMPVGAVPGAHEDELAAPLYGFRPRVMARPPAAG